jgi:diadenosine tetraphosphatase ApaH/serine/threonine PP2A family protein phosphatase
VLSDVHSNEPALRATLADADRVGIDALLCLGDLVGYGADPGPVVELLAARDPVVVAGNHDRAAVGMADLDWFNPHARRAAEWTAGRLSAGQARYLGALPLLAERSGAVLAHGSPWEPERWTYLVSPEDGAEAMRMVDAALVFVGHSHLPACWSLSAAGTASFEPAPRLVRLEPATRHLVNVGSVGQPRDGDPQAAYAVWDLEAGTVEIRRVGYDVDEARRRIHAAGLPRILGDRLLRGR